MSIAQLINRAVVIESRLADPDLLDEAGNAIDDVLAIETVAELQPKSVAEPNAHPDISDADWVGYFLPEDAEYLDSASSVWAPGMGTFEVIGRSPTWTWPRTQTDAYVEVDLNRVAGPGDSEGS